MMELIVQEIALPLQAQIPSQIQEEELKVELMQKMVHLQ